MAAPTTPKTKDTLLKYLRVQENFDRELYALLRRTSSDVDQQLKLVLGDGIGAQIRRDQLVAVKRSLHVQMATILKREGLLIAAAREQAAAAAMATFQTYEKMLWVALSGSDARLMELYLTSARATASSGLNAAIARMQGTSYNPLAASVYNTQQLAAGVVDRYVESALAQGLSARELAQGVKSMILPNVRGGVSYAAQRLGRTEINNAFHAMQAKKARETPWITGVKWNLSGSHPTPDDCNAFAEGVHYDGGDPGVFRSSDIPRKPHPQCLCYTTPETPSDDEWLDTFFSGGYDAHIDSVIANAL